MSEIDHGFKPHQLLLNAMCKEAWGESLDVCDPGDLLEALRPAFGDAIGAIEDRNEAVGILLDLHEKLGASGTESVSMLFQVSAWTGSTPALADACKKAVGYAGVAVVDLLLTELTNEEDEEGAADLVFGTCRFAVHGLTGCDQRLGVLQSSYEAALCMTDDATVADVLREGRAIAAKQEGGLAVETLLDYYRDAVLEMSGDPWSFLEVLAENLRAVTQRAADDDATFEQITRILQEAITDENVEGLWEYYEHRLDWLGQTEHVETLLEAYERTIHTIRDLKWLVDRVLEVCDDIVHASDDHSIWLPDRLQLSRACVDVIETVGSRAAARTAISEAFELAIHDTGDPWGVMYKAFRDVMARADDEAQWRIAASMIRACQRVTSEVFAKVASSAQSTVEDRERIVDLLLKAGEKERAFWAFQRVQEAAVADRRREVEWLLEALSERETDRDWASRSDDPPETPLFRAFSLAATALSDPSTAVNLVATIHMATYGTAHDIDIEHALPHFVRVIEALEDPASETEVMYDAYISAITDGNDPGFAVRALLDAARETIADTDDPAAAAKMLLSGLSVQPSGWPPPTPAWMTP